MSVKFVVTDFNHNELTTKVIVHPACVEFQRDVNTVLSLNANACHKMSWDDWDKLVAVVEGERKLIAKKINVVTLNPDKDAQ